MLYHSISFICKRNYANQLIDVILVNFWNFWTNYGVNFFFIIFFFKYCIVYSNKQVKIREQYYIMYSNKQSKKKSKVNFFGDSENLHLWLYDVISKFHQNRSVNKKSTGVGVKEKSYKERLVNHSHFPNIRAGIPCRFPIIFRPIAHSLNQFELRKIACRLLFYYRVY